MVKNPKVAFVGRNGRRYAARSTHEGYGIPASLWLKSKADTHTYEQCAAFLGGEAERVVASNVKVVRLSPGSIAIRLYATDIITYYEDGTFSWTNGGYYTPTTSARANQFGPKGVWFSNHKMQLWANGTCEGEGVRKRVPAPPAH